MKQVNFTLPLRMLTLLCVLVLSVSAFAQQIAVKGHVKDETGEPIIGATIRVVGQTGGAVTDFDGNFTINANTGDMISVSYIGYDVFEAPATAKMTITLKEAKGESINEVVVIGYGRVKKNDLTGSVTALNAEKMVKGAVTSATDMLVGKAAGVSVITDGGAPGAGATIRIRGGSSMSASNNPLVVIDGVPVDDGGINGMANPLSTVHPDDIATMTVLKDASATAIYGSRASNGVILITTKKGKAGGIQVGYSGSVKVSTHAKEVDVMSANDFKKFVTSKFGEQSMQAKALGTSDTNWQKEVLRTSVSTDHNINVSGAVANLPYRVSVGYTNENGIVKTSNMERFTGAINLNPQFFDKHLSIQLNLKGIYNTNRFADLASLGMATQYDPTQPIYMKGSEYGNGYFMYLNDKGKPVDIGLANPVSILTDKSDKTKVYRSIGNAQFDYKFHFLPDLRANLNLGYDVSKGTGDVITVDNSPMSWTWGNFKKGFGENSSFWQLKRNTLLEFYMNYTKTFGAHFIDAMAGYSWQHFYRSEWTKYPYSEAKAKEYGKEFYKGEDDFSTENYLVSFFGRVNYTLLDRYLLTFTLRNDGSSRFSKDNRWGVFPSAALAWRINEEAFLKDVRWLDDLKLRLGYGVTGQQNLGSGDYPYMARYAYSQPGANYYFGDKRIRLIAPLAYDENLKWEETTTYNLGLDFGIFKGVLSGALDFYFRQTNNLLNTVTAPAGTNFSNELLTNVGTLENKGVELSLTAHPITTKDFQWTVGYNVSYNKNTITKLTFNDDPKYKGVIHGGIDGATGYNIQINAVNKPYNSFYVFEQMYDENGTPIEGAYVDQNNDNKIDEADLIPYKKSAPDVYMGLTSQMNYKNWDLSFALRSSIGNYVYNNTQSNREAWDGSQMYDQTGFLKNRLNSAANKNFHIGQFRSSYYVQKADFVRMDNFTLGYTFNKLFNDKQSARLYFTVQNPFVITNYSGIDPEISGEGIDKNIYPRPISFMFGFNFKF
ncbi:MAG: TonB-dependent receptor [Prevotella sp.]|nr:TonB-dependent receptor [Prevotellaceae bacterium]MDY3103157.1 TonB-dependent receptor [Prevotella sp.]MDY5843530.1 TonB-dependent receptor [Prevotella sp.]